jgi:hypothetical protein
MKHRFEPYPTTGSMKTLYIAICQAIYGRCVMNVSERKLGIFSELVVWDSTFWTVAAVSTCYKDLLWIVADEDSKDGMAPAPDPIPTHHFDASFANGGDWCKYISHAEMKEVHLCAAVRSLGSHALEFCCWNVSHQNVATS